MQQPWWGVGTASLAGNAAHSNVSWNFLLTWGLAIKLLTGLLKVQRGNPGCMGGWQQSKPTAKVNIVSPEMCGKTKLHIPTTAVEKKEVKCTGWGAGPKSWPLMSHDWSRINPALCCFLKSLLAGRFPYLLWPLTSLSLRRFNRVLHDGCHTKHILHHTLQCVLYVCLLQTQPQTVTSTFSSGENHCRHFTQLCQTPPPKKKQQASMEFLYNNSGNSAHSTASRLYPVIIEL